jgi:hypothetical protein
LRIRFPLAMRNCPTLLRRAPSRRVRPRKHVRLTNVLRETKKERKTTTEHPLVPHPSAWGRCEDAGDKKQKTNACSSLGRGKKKSPIWSLRETSKEPAQLYPCPSSTKMHATVRVQRGCFVKIMRQCNGGEEKTSCSAVPFALVRRLSCKRKIHDHKTGPLKCVRSR